jgi:hypothetical protein
MLSQLLHVAVDATAAPWAPQCVPESLLPLRICVR